MDKKFLKMSNQYGKFHFQWINLVCLILCTLTMIADTKPQFESSSQIDPAAQIIEENRNLFRRNYDIKQKEDVEDGPQMVPRVKSRRNRTKRPSLPSLNGDIIVTRGNDGQLTFQYHDMHPTPTSAPLIESSPPNTEITVRATSDRIIFPNEMEGLVSGFVPKVDRCKESVRHCNSIENYPQALLDDILRKQPDRYGYFFGDDVVSSNGDNLMQRIDVPGEESFCTSSETVIHPQAGETSDNKWVYIVNHANYTQGVRVETCQHPNQKCSFTDNLPSVYTTECQQKYAYRTLLTFDENGKTHKAQIKFPSCCKCIVKTLDRHSRSIQEDRMTPVRRKN